MSNKLVTKNKTIMADKLLALEKEIPLGPPFAKGDLGGFSANLLAQRFY
jgi:hypothetical protein